MKKIKIIENGVLDQNTMLQLKGGATCESGKPCHRFGEGCNGGYINQRCVIHIECPNNYSTCQSDSNYSYPCGIGKAYYKSGLFKVRF